MRAAAAYAAAALLLTWPLALHPLSWLGSTQGPGDAYLNLWILGWDLQAIVHDPLAVVSGRVFDANIFHPAAGTLTYSDHLLPQALALSPIYLLTGNLALCYNLLLVGSLVLCALAMHAFVREIAGDSPAAWVAGVAWGFAPYHFSHLIHLQLQALYFFPLTFLFLHRLFVGGRRRDACLLGLTLAAQTLSSVYYGVMGAMAIALAAVVYLIAAGWPRARAIAGRLVLAALIGAAVVAPVALKYWWVQQREGFGRSLHEASQGSATVRSYLEVPATNLIYGHTGVLRSHDAGDPLHKASEQNLFPGFLLLGLAIVGAASMPRRGQRANAVVLAAVAVTGLILSLGPEGVRPLYAGLYQAVFGFQAIRAPARFAVLTLFGLAGLAALGADRLSRPRAAAILALLLLIEYANAPIRYAPAPQIETATGQWLRDNPEPGAVMYLPLELDPASNTTFMVQSLVHRRPIVNGYSGQRPSYFTALADTMARFPSAESVRTLLDLRVKFVVARQALDAGGLPPDALVKRAQFEDGVIYEIRHTPELDSTLALPETPPLPEPVSIPFSIGETATYSVVWASGPLSIPAAQIVFEVRPGQGGAKYELTASGTTADWVSRFFQADDRFTSQVDDRLRPSSFEQHLKEGRRQVDRRVRFDRPARVVRIQQGSGPEISVPAAADTLDPLAAFYYARTLPLSAGSIVRIPIHDSNRNLILDLHVGDTETITHKGVQTQAIRTSPQIRRAEGPSPVQLTIWFARDRTRMPLVVEIAGIVGLGAVRLELESIR